MKKIPHGVWQISALMLLHFTADMVGGILPGILPVLRDNFGMTLKMGVIFLAIRSISSNFCQVAVGPLRKNSSRPFFIYIGLILLSMIGIFGFLPQNTPFVVLAILSAIFGCGTAVVHPEGLRGAMAIKDINGATTTALFMTMGFFDFSCGPLVGAFLIDSPWELKSLIAVTVLLLLAMLAIFASKVVLLTDKADKNKQNNTANIDNRWSFPLLFLIAFFMNSGSTVLQSLLPTFLHEVNDFSLKMGGLGSMLFGLGSASGSICSGIWAKKIKPSTLTMANLSTGVLLWILYLVLCRSKWALAILFFAGFTVSSSLPLLVVMARNVRSKLVIGLKMGIMVGGSWGTAGLVLFLLSFFVEKIGLPNVMIIVCALYGIALALALAGTFLRRRKAE